jgi:membrane-associated phospholipid phosphatase
MAVAARTVQRGHSLYEWIAFAIQMLIAISVEIGDDIGRGFFSQHGTEQGLADAHHIVNFEAAHGFWVEPAWQMFFRQSHTVLAFTITWPEAERLMNAIYIGGHIFVTIGVALWVYAYRRRYFPLLRNTLILANALALVLYESFPVAPPRIMHNLMYNHHVFNFADTMYGIVQSGRNLVGTQSAGYNEFSAMPSVHMAWALLAGFALVLLARPFTVKLLGIIYPIAMLLAVVVTGNHYLLDAAGAVFVLAVAGLAAFTFECGRSRISWPSISFRAFYRSGELEPIPSELENAG